MRLLGHAEPIAHERGAGGGGGGLTVRLPAAPPDGASHAFVLALALAAPAATPAFGPAAPKSTKTCLR